MLTRSAPAARAKGLVALLALVLLVVGVPWLMFHIGAGPVPDRWASPSEIWNGMTTPDDGSVLLVAFRYAAWLAWLFVVLSILLELGARLLGTDVPQLPGLSLPQGLARYVVGTAALVFISVPAVGSWATASAAPMSADTTTGASTAVAGGVAGVSASSVIAEQETSPDQAAPTTFAHEVAPGESLWSIAQQHLGDGSRYAEILELNRDSVAASNWISPGQVLQVPDERPDPPAADTHTVEQGETLWQIAEDELGDGARYPEIVDATGAVEQPDGERLSDPDLIRPGWELNLHDGAEGASATEREHRPEPDPAPAVTPDQPAGPDDRAPSPGLLPDGARQDAVTGTASAVAADAAADAAAASADRDPLLGDDPADAWGSTVLGLSGLTAAGLVALLEGVRRRRAGTFGRPGHAGTGDLERELRLSADVHTADTVDLALRHVAVAAREAGRALPGLRSVRMTRTQLDLQLTEPMRLPAPWTSTADPRLWTLSVDRAATLDAGALTHVPAPFPSLVPVGQDEEDAHVLVNLADARTFAVVGEGHHTRDALAAMTLSLASAPWSDATTVTVIGGHPELEQVIDSPRVRFVQDMTSYTLSVQVQIEPTAREVIIVSGDLDATDRRRLDTAVSSSPRVSLVHAATTTPDGSPALTLGDDPDTAVLSPAYLQLRAQRLTTHDAARLGLLFALAAPSSDQWAPPPGEPTLARVGAAAAAMGAPGIVINPSDEAVDDAPTVRRSGMDDQVSPRTPVRWNTPVHTPSDRTPSIPGEDVRTVRRTSGLDATAMTSIPGWLSNQITPTPGTPLPPVVAFPERVRELAAPTDQPVLRLLGPVDIDNVGEVAAAHRMRLTELAAFVNTHPQATGTQIDDALWPNRAQHDHSLVRGRSLTGLGAWLGSDEDPDSATGLAAARGLVSDWQLFERLVPADPATAGTEHLEQALGLVRGAPFAGVHPRHYVWAQELRSRMIFAITTAATELSRRRLMEGRWTAALDATVVGLTVEPGVEALWRLQLLAAHELGDVEARSAAAVGLSDCGRPGERPDEQASIDLLDTLSRLRGQDFPASTHRAV